ncbi:MAG: hypothetical protein IJ971_04770 [Bacteroidales bacterium]|nr:hypothetical protein [Bacteroidales bacterium]
MDRDILAAKPELKNMPYCVPEGYFETFKAQAVPYREKEIGLVGRLMPYAAMAAVFVFLVTAGTFFLQRTSPVEEFTHEDFLVFSSGISNSEYYESMNQIADAGLADEDIIAYLIYSGISAEEIELYK